MAEITQAIKKKAAELGFCKVGITRAAELADEAARLRAWLARGYHGTMDWMERNVEKRSDVRSIVPNAKSVICVAMNYYTDSEHQKDPAVGKISRYAWGDDYHIVMTERLEKLTEFIRTLFPDAVAKPYVDTGPVMDKVWAARAGLGWQGKHTNLITKEFGSWVFLGEIILDKELDYDAPIEDFCGSCTACLEACPTQAITEPYVLDSTKCISYLTIEHRGGIADELTARFENWVYGCDICQDVCPWNRFQQVTGEVSFQPRSYNLAPALTELASMNDESFRAKFRRSPVKRTKREGLVRNARAAMKRHKEVLPS